MAIVPFLISSSMLNFFNLGGLIEEINFIFLINMIMPHFLKLFLDTGLVMKMVQRYFLKSFLEERKGGPYTQMKANEIVSRSDFYISYSYSYVFSTLGSSMFYFSIFPLGIVYAILSLIIHFWVQKVRFY